MVEDDSGTSNLVAFPARAAEADPARAGTSASSRHNDLIRRLETIATTIGVPVATFLGAAQERVDPKSGESGSAAPSQTAELLQLFGRISDGQTRDQCLNLLRMLASGGAEPSR